MKVNYSKEFREIVEAIDTIHFEEKLFHNCKKLEELRDKLNIHSLLIVKVNTEIKSLHLLHDLISIKTINKVKYNNLSEEALSYLKKRINSTKNKLINSIYYLLYYINDNKEEYIINSINEYCFQPQGNIEDTLNNLLKEHCIIRNPMCANTFIKYIQVLYNIAECKYLTDCIKKLNKIIKLIILNKKIYFEDRRTILSFILDKKNDKDSKVKIDKDYVNSILDGLKKELNELKEESINNNMVIIEILKICKCISYKTNIGKKEDWDKKISQAYQEEVDNCDDDFRKVILLEKAVNYDKSVQPIYEKTKKDWNPPSIELPLDKLYEIAKDLIVKNSSPFSNFIKLIKEIKITTNNKENSSTPLLNDSNNILFNSNNNIQSKNFNINSFLNNSFYWNLYGDSMKEIINRDYNQINEYFHLHSWFKDEEDILSLIDPSLKIILKKEKTDEDIILAMDSLTTKFDMIIRRLCEKNDIIISEKEEEKTANHLFKKEKSNIINIMGQSDYDFVSYVLFKDHEGLNIRNEIAHSLNDKVYSEKKLLLLLICLIKLASIDNLASD